jgi:hypothetical protein
MLEQPAQNVTMLLRAWTGGDERALGQLMPVVVRKNKLGFGVEAM